MFVLTEAERDRLDRLPWNRSKKHIRQQRRLMAALGRVVKVSVVHTHQVMLDDEISRVRTKLTSEEWDVEWRLANGQTFDDVAEALRVKPEVLRKRASRWRSRVRSQVR